MEIGTPADGFNPLASQTTQVTSSHQKILPNNLQVAKRITLVAEQRPLNTVQQVPSDMKNRKIQFTTEPTKESKVFQGTQVKKQAEAVRSLAKGSLFVASPTKSNKKRSFSLNPDSATHTSTFAKQKIA